LKKQFVDGDPLFLTTGRKLLFLRFPLLDAAPGGTGMTRVSICRMPLLRQ